MGIGSKLDAWMKAKDTNANELAQKIGITSSTLYSMLQRDSSRVDIDLIIQIANALGITADELLNGPDLEQIHTAAAHLDSKDFTEDEWEAVTKFAAFVKEQKKAEK